MPIPVTNDAGWTWDFPKETGHYWFYGWTSPFSKGGRLPELEHVEVSKLGDTNMFVANGAFVYEQEMEGMWQKIVTPTTPIFPPHVMSDSIVKFSDGRKRKVSYVKYELGYAHIDGKQVPLTEIELCTED